MGLIQGEWTRFRLTEQTRRQTLPFTIFLLAALPALFPLPLVSAAADQSVICDRAAVLAASQTGVPVSVLKAISLTETGRDRGTVARPWPWTVNMEGKGFWFETEAAALAYSEEHFKRGARSFDVGCFQINYKWHHQNFDSIEDMFDPANNALYAARFLSELYAEKGNWEAAAGAYHSRNPDYADRYKARFAAYRADLRHEDSLPLHVVAIEPDQAQPATIAAPSAPVRVNTFPLLQAGGATSIGSLVPLSATPSLGSLFPGAG